jgi:hypothetical protein
MVCIKNYKGLNLENKKKQEYIQLINDLYFRFQNNEEIKKRFNNDDVYNKLIKALHTFYYNRNIKDSLKLSNNIDAVNNIFRELNNFTKDASSISVHNVQVIQYSNQLISACDELLNKNENDEEFSEEEFINRYEHLVTLLNDSAEKSNLILYTKTDKQPFKLFKNSNNSISAAIGMGSNISLTKERVGNIIYRNQESTYHKSYVDVFIEKLLDNSVFDEIKTDSNTLDFSHMPEARIQKLEEDRLKNSGLIKDLEDKLSKRENDFTQLQTLLTKASTLEEDFNNAKDAVLKNIELKQATSYWKEQADKYNSTYKVYFWINISIAVVLLISTFILINYSGLFIQNLPLDKNSNGTINSLKVLVHSAPFFNYVLFILYTTIVIWIMKILVKIMLSNYHLKVDANERVIMLNTYLVLLEDGKGFDEKDKKVILDNIFRQTNHGIIKDETSVTVADIVSSFKK